MLLAAVYIISIFSVELFIIHKHLQLISYAFTGKPVSPDNGGLDTFLENTDGNIWRRHYRRDGKQRQSLLGLTCHRNCHVPYS